MNTMNPRLIEWDGGVFLEGNYAVLLGKQEVGRVVLRKQGLYYHICCRCRLPESNIFRLRITCGDTSENAGVLVPQGNGFLLDTKIPVKRLKGGIPEFSLISKTEKAEGTFAPVYPDEPFAYISNLKESYLSRKNGQLGISIK